MTFTKATKKQAKLRLAQFGPSGSGKTFTALRIAKGLGGRVALVDTERGSASKYGDRFDFDVVEAKEGTIDEFVTLIEAAAKEKYDVLILDSMSHPWQELLGEVDKLAHAKFKGNTWSAWSEGTPKQRDFIDSILSFPGHIIATMRSKTEWALSQENGKSKPTRVGLAPEQGKGIEYEFDLLIELSTDHVATVLKDRTGKFQDKIIDKPSEKLGEQLKAWLADGEAVAQAQPTPPPKPASEKGAEPAPSKDKLTYEDEIWPIGKKKGKKFKDVDRTTLQTGVQWMKDNAKDKYASLIKKAEKYLNDTGLPAELDDPVNQEFGVKKTSALMDLIEHATESKTLDIVSGKAKKHLDEAEITEIQYNLINGAIKSAREVLG